MSDEDLLCLAPAGFVHLEILSNVNYLAAVAEDTWFYTEEEAKRVAERIKSLEQQYALDVVIANARDVLKFLSDERLSRISSTSVIVEHALFEELTSLADVTESIDAFERSLGDTRNYRSLFRASPDKRLATGVGVGNDSGCVRPERARLPRDCRHVAMNPEVLVRQWGSVNW